jgi:glycosyltransferase involved in cell wall biosynthesis
MKNKKVLVFESYPVFSGAQRVSLNFCKALKAENFYITLLLADDPTNIHHEMFGPYVDEIIMVNTSDTLKQYGNSDRWFKPSNFFNSIFKGLVPFYSQCFKILKKGKFDSMYFCDPRGAVMMLYLCMFFKGKKICYLQGKNKLRPSFARLIYLTFTNHLMCPSTDVLESLPPSPKKMVLNYGIDFSQYGAINADAVKTEISGLLKPELAGRTKLLFAGLIRPQKGVHHLIYAMKAVKDAFTPEQMPVLFLLGNPKTKPEENFKDHLVEYCHANGLDEYVYWIGWRDNVLEWMKNCDYFIFPTIDKEACDFEGFDKVIESSEGSPVVLIESSLCGLYTIAAKVTGVNETITNGHNGIMYNPNDNQALANVLINTLKTKPKFVDFPNAERFSPKTFSDKILNII